MYKCIFLLAYLIQLSKSTLCQNYDFNPNVPYNTQKLNADYNSNNIVQKNGIMELQLTKSTGGTRLSFDDTIHYATIETIFKISPGQNVVSSFILIADNGDEVDFEFVQNTANKTDIIQTNFYYKGIPLYDTNAELFKIPFALSDNFYKYTLNWTPDFYEWKFNDFSLRKLFKNKTSSYPDSPSKLQFGGKHLQVLGQETEYNGLNHSYFIFHLLKLIVTMFYQLLPLIFQQQLIFLQLPQIFPQLPLISKWLSQIPLPQRLLVFHVVLQKHLYILFLRMQYP